MVDSFAKEALEVQQTDSVPMQIVMPEKTIPPIFISSVFSYTPDPVVRPSLKCSRSSPTLYPPLPSKPINSPSSDLCFCPFPILKISLFHLLFLLKRPFLLIETFPHRLPTLKSPFLSQLRSKPMKIPPFLLA